MDLPTLLTGLAHGTFPNVTGDTVRAERVGSLLSNGVDPDSAEGRHWDRLLCAVYDGDRKHQWDSQGGRVVYRLDAERPNWQARTDEEFDPAGFEAFFSEDAAAYKERAAGGETAPDVDDATRNRLEDLGYV